MIARSRDAGSAFTDKCFMGENWCPEAASVVGGVVFTDVLHVRAVAQHHDGDDSAVGALNHALRSCRWCASSFSATRLSTSRMICPGSMPPPPENHPW